MSMRNDSPVLRTAQPIHEISPPTDHQHHSHQIRHLCRPCDLVVVEAEPIGHEDGQERCARFVQPTAVQVMHAASWRAKIGSRYVMVFARSTSFSYVLL
jgi:hypothetical protein